MNVGNINKKRKNPRILLAPLDWGLGHTTRCIALIRLLLRENAEVILAASPVHELILKKEFPSLVILRLKGYNIRYSANKNLFFIKMAFQLPRILSIIGYEKRWLKKAIKKYEIDGVISDNRFGFHHPDVPCVFITHQLFIECGKELLNKAAQKINYHYINKFRECWVPDAKGDHNLAGKLSHPNLMPHTPVYYLGILSRFEEKITEKKYDLLIMLSGPEPQRTVFENLLLEQIKDIPGTIIMVRGLPGLNYELNIKDKNISVYNYLPAKELNECIQQSKTVLARCGYSTVMDLAVLKQKAILVPTPGQTEQEYLAGYLKEKNIYYTTSQQGFMLKKTLHEVNHADYHSSPIATEINESVVTEWLDKL